MLVSDIKGSLESVSRVFLITTDVWENFLSEKINIFKYKKYN